MEETMEPCAVAPERQRDIGIITEEIQFYKDQAGVSIVEIGKRLIEAKEQLAHGQWLPWLSEKVNFSETMAQRFMRVAREFSNPAPVRDLGLTKALLLLEVDEEKREQFMEERHEVNGEEKTVYEMSRRELEQAIRERDEARAERDRARQDAEGRAMAAADVQAALEEARSTAEQLQQELNEQRAAAANDAQNAAAEMERLGRELETLRTTPREVAVEKVVDEDAVKAAAELQKKLDKAKADKEKAEQAKLRAEQEMVTLKVAQEEAAAVAAQEKKAMEERMSDLQKKLAVASSSEMVIFKMHFEQGQTSVNKMNECIAKMQEAGDGEGAAKLRNALRAMLTASLEALG